VAADQRGGRGHPVPGQLGQPPRRHQRLDAELPQPQAADLGDLVQVLRDRLAAAARRRAPAPPFQVRHPGSMGDLGQPVQCAPLGRVREPGQLAAQLDRAADPEAAAAQIEAVQADAAGQVADARADVAREAQRRQRAEADAEEARSAAAEADTQLAAATAAKTAAEQARAETERARAETDQAIAAARADAQAQVTQIREDAEARVRAAGQDRDQAVTEASDADDTG
jgi:hypothetical protein